MVAAQDAAAVASSPPSPAEPVEPVIDDRESRRAKAIARARQPESQLIEDEAVVPGRGVSPNWRALAEGDEPFASSVVKRSRPARYWGS